MILNLNLTRDLVDMVFFKIKFDFIKVKAWVFKNLFLLMPTIIFVFICLLLGLSVVYQFICDENLEFGFCLTESCLKVVLDNFNVTLSLFDWSLKALAVWFAVATLFIGLKTYELSVKNSESSDNNSKINNHINNFNMFCSFIDSNFKGRPILKSNRIDVFCLYNIIFPDSKSGQLSNFSIYSDLVLNVRGQLIESSKVYKKSCRKESKPFCYMNHQDEIIQKFNKLGVKLEKLHKNDFYFIEDELIELFDIITKTFTSLPNNKYLLSSINRHYR